MIDLLQRLNGAELLGLAAILGGAAVLALLIVTIGWASMRSARITADLKRDMLARGLSVSDIERLTLSETERAAAAEADRKAREAQINADLKRDMLARGLSVDQIRQLTGEVEEKYHSDAVVLADAITKMVHEGELDHDAVAGLLTSFLRRADAGPRTPRSAAGVKPEDLLLERITEGQAANNAAGERA